MSDLHISFPSHPLPVLAHHPQFYCFWEGSLWSDHLFFLLKTEHVAVGGSIANQTCLGKFGIQCPFSGDLGGEDPLKKEMATSSSTLAWEIPWTEEPGGLQSMGSQRVGHE